MLRRLHRVNTITRLQKHIGRRLAGQLASNEASHGDKIAPIGYG